MNKTIIFDLDGTLINLNIDFKQLQLKIKETLNMEQDPTPLLDAIIAHTTNNPILRQKAWDIIDQIEVESINRLTLFPETIRVLNELRKNQYQLTLVTFQGRKAADIIIQKYFPNFFNPIITREHSHSRSRQIEMVIEKMNLAKNQVIMIGDRLNDVKSSKTLGVNCILIRRRFNPLEGTIVIKSLSELFQHL